MANWADLEEVETLRGARATPREGHASSSYFREANKVLSSSCASTRDRSAPRAILYSE